MELREIQPNELDRFVGSQTNSQLLQSASWSLFQQEVGRQVWRFGVFLNNRLITAAVIIGNQLPLAKSYLYCPRGPIFEDRLTEEERTEALKLILSKARDLTIQTKSSEEIFFRLEPTTAVNLPLVPTTSIQPANTLILDLEQSEEKLLTGMHQKTRYNIKLAQKHNLEIKRADSFDQVWPLFKQTSERDKFKLHAKNYYQKMLSGVKEIELWIASTNDAIIAGNLIGYFGDTATYLHGASGYNYRNLMAPYLLQWEVIKQAKARGFKYYDFHGIAPDNNQNHPWSGITRFKKGFGGEVKKYPGTYDFIYQPKWYKLYKLFRKINRVLK